MKETEIYENRALGEPLICDGLGVPLPASYIITVTRQFTADPLTEYAFPITYGVLHYCRMLKPDPLTYKGGVKPLICTEPGEPDDLLKPGRYPLIYHRTNVHKKPKPHFYIDRGRGEIFQISPTCPSRGDNPDGGCTGCIYPSITTDFRSVEYSYNAFELLRDFCIPDLEALDHDNDVTRFGELVIR